MFRGQGAIEYILTIGVGILIVAIVVATLSSAIFGPQINQPSQNLKDVNSSFNTARGQNGIPSQHTFPENPTGATPTCFDGIQNQDETGIDCGGSCPSLCGIGGTGGTTGRSTGGSGAGGSGGSSGGGSGGGASGGSGNTGGTTSQDTNAPTIPTGVHATVNSTTQITLDWNTSTDNVGVIGYTIYRDDSNIGTTVTTSFPDTGLLPSTSYTYTIAAFDAAGNNSLKSTPLIATTLTNMAADTNAPTTPTNLTATPTSQNQISLTWTASTDTVGVVGYTVYRNDVNVGTTHSTQFNDISLTPSTTYTYTVSAFDAAGNNSNKSLSATATTQLSTANLVGYWTFDAGTAIDSSGNGNNGSLIGSPTSVTGKVNNALSLNGTSQYVRIPSGGGIGAQSTLNFSSGFTVSAWILTNNTSSLQFIAQQGYGIKGWYFGVNGSGVLTSTYILSSGNANSVTGGTIATGTWHYVAFVCGDNGQAKLYLDGNQVGVSTCNALLLDTTMPLTIGADTYGGNYFSGSIDEVRIYNRALSLAEVGQLYGITGGSTDTNAPTVSLTAPSAGTVLGTITVSATATDNVGVVGVQFKLDGTNLQSEDTSAPYSISWDTTTTINGAHTLTATARDVAGNSTTSSSVSVTVNNPAPTLSISNISSTGITTTSATVNWTTNITSSSQIDYGTTAGYGTSTTLNASLVTSHTQNISGLAANTIYHYRVRSVDGSSHTATSTDQTFTTNSVGVSGVYYVSKNGSNANGTSWAAAWNELDQINWNTISAGSIIYIDGGASSMSYTTTLTPTKGGTSDSQRITIQRSTEVGHNGTVNMRRANISYPYTTIDGVTRDKFIVSCVTGEYTFRVNSGASNFVLTNLSMMATFGVDASTTGTPLFADNQNLTIKNVHFDSTNYEDQVKFNGTGTLRIEDSLFTGLVEHGAIHEDAVQVDIGYVDLVILRNIFHPADYTDCFMMGNVTGGGGQGNAEYAYNVFDHCADSIKADSFTSLRVYNNLFDSTRDIIGTAPTEIIRNNIYTGTTNQFNENNIHLSGGAQYSLWDVNASGVRTGWTDDLGGTGNVARTLAQPLFVNQAGHDYHLVAGSPAINAGTAALDRTYTTDVEGNPIVGIPDIGPYEYQ